MGVALDHAPESLIDLANLPRAGEKPVATTLLALVEAVSNVSHNEREVVATVAHMLRSGRVKLTGCFRDAPRDAFRI